MSELVITLIVVILLIGLVIFWRKRKQCSSCCSSTRTPKSESKTTEQVKPQESGSALNTSEPAKAAVAASPEPSNIETAVKPLHPNAANSTESTALIPQDSVLKRHYITHVCTMVESLNPGRPTDSVLSRHYDAMIISRIMQCLNDKNALDQLIIAYESNKR
jgi:FtsZ-interacting cell division protein ZipA